MSQFKDFDGEFQPVKKYTEQELHSDKFIMRLGWEKKLNKESNPKDSTLSKQSQTSEVKGPIDVGKSSDKPRKRVMLVGTNELKEVLKKKKRKRVMLVGTKALNELLERKRKEKEMEAQNEETQDSTNKRRRITLIPFPREASPKKKGTLVPALGDSLSDSLDSDEEFVDALLEFHNVSEVELQGLKPGENDHVTQVELSESESDNSVVRTDENTDLPTEIDLEDEQLEEEILKQELMKEMQEIQMLENAVGFEEEKNGRNINEYAHGTINDVPVCASDVLLMKKTIKFQLSGLSFPLLQQSSLAQPYKEIYTLIEHTIRDSEGHSTLLVGPRGSGKTLITDTAIAALREKYQNLFITIKLNAFLHSDDNLAVREIARQLDIHSRLVRETEQSDTFEQRAINDTFTNILLTLDSRTPGHKKLAVLVVILIDEMEKFTAGKQTLLYNLFEFSQNSSIPICVVGISTKITTRELLEKRVRSRFSQRIICISRAPTLGEFWDNTKLNLQVAELDMHKFTDADYPKRWNQHINSLFEYPSGLKKVVYKVYYTTRNYKDVYHCCQLPVSAISESDPFPRSDKFELYLDQISPGDAQSIVESLSSLELLLALAAARWVEKAEVPHVNFNLAYKEYKEMIERLNVEATTVSGNSFVDSTILAGVKVSQKIWSPVVLRDCWANLYKTGLLFDVITTNNEVNINNSYNMYKNMVLEDSKMLQLDITLEELGLLIDDSYKKWARL